MENNEFAPQHLDMHYVVMESSPVEWRGGSDQHYVFKPGMRVDLGVEQHVSHARNLLQGFIERAGLLEIDAGECALCTRGIGYQMYEHDTDIGISGGTSWVWTTAVYYGRVHDVLFVCEDCSPHAIRDLFDERQRNLKIKES